MSSGTVERVRTSTAANVRDKRSMALLVLFIALGCVISISLTLVAGSSSSGVLIGAGALLLVVPMAAWVVKAFPQAIDSAKQLKANWTWWHPLWFFLFFSTLVFRIRDVGAASSNPLDSYAMLRVIPEGLRCPHAHHPAHSEEAELAWCVVPGHSRSDGDLLPGMSGDDGMVRESRLDGL